MHLHYRQAFYRTRYIIALLSLLKVIADRWSDYSDESILFNLLHEISVKKRNYKGEGSTLNRNRCLEA